MHVTLANPRGFCAGVDRAIDIVNRALEVFGTPVYVRHEVVHNKTVVDDLRLEVHFLSMNSTKSLMTLLSFLCPWGVRAVQDEAVRRQLKVFDATRPCTKVYGSIKFSKEGREAF